MMKSKPKCVIITCRPGSGKSTLSWELCSILHMPLVSRDIIKEGLVCTFGVSHDRLPAEANREATETFFSIVEKHLERNVSVLVEAAFQHKVWEVVIDGWATISDLYFLICEVDPELAAQRHLERGLKDPNRGFFHGDHRVSAFKETGEVLPAGEYAPPSFEFPSLRVDTTDGYVPGLATIKDFVTPKESAQQPRIGSE